MALIDRLARDDPQPADGKHLSNHAFAAATWFWGKGELTRAQVIAGLGLTADDEAQLDQLATFYQGLTNALKAEFFSRVESAGVLLEQGLISRAKYKTLLGMT